ncbi:MAG TPA: TrbI/VirB10 family protein [Allosphingosinicella sp.]|nr:TrbI/VirB10 family protein [Allosphingosinicella sp.]
MARLPEEADAMPMVRRPRSGLPVWAIAALVLVAALMLFLVLDGRRRDASAPSVRPRAADALNAAAPPPPLFVPQAPIPVAVPVAPAPAQAAPAPRPQIVYIPQAVPIPAPAPLPEVPIPQPQPQRIGNEAALVFDAGVAASGGAAGAAEGAAAPAADAANAAAGPAPQGGGRARAGVFANRGTTVAQGTLIPAVLETALDSTRPGFARAIVSRDVRGFDGSRVLIPRGSRLIGEYRSEVAPGQRRALVNWTRLIRPDGVTIAIGSPAGDPLGRGGIRARVNTHFFERFAGAILQSALDIGVNLATGLANDGDTVVVVPATGAVQQSTSQIIQPAQITPTLSVRQGTSISIFVARDLDFTGVEARR